MSTPPLSETALPAPPSARVRLDFLDGLRALAALFVLFNHSYVTVWSLQNNLIPPASVSRVFGILKNGHYAVDLFIVLSGYCLMLPIVFGNGSLRGGAINFYKKRARRILPPYYAILTISLLFALTILREKTVSGWDVGLPVTVYGVLTHYLLLQDIFTRGAGQLGYQLWTIPVEWHIYFLFPLFVVGFQKIGGRRTTALITLVALVAVKLMKYIPTTAAFPPPYLALFAFGMMGAVISFSREKAWQAVRERVSWGGIATGLAVLIALIWIVDARRALMYTNYVDFLVGVCSASVCIAAARPEQNWLSRFLNWKPLVYIGGFSYSLYLVHVAALTVIWRYVLRPLHLNDAAAFAFLAIVGAPVVVGCAYLFHLAFERPFMSGHPHNAKQAAKAAIISPAP